MLMNKFQEIGHSGIDQYVQYEASMPAYMGRTANQRKVPKWLSFKKL